MRFNQFKNELLNKGASPQMPATVNIEKQFLSVGDPSSQKISTSGLTLPKTLQYTRAVDKSSYKLQYC